MPRWKKFVPLYMLKKCLVLQRKKVKFIIYLKFQFDNLCENVHDFSLEDKTNIEDDEAIDLSKI